MSAEQQEMEARLEDELLLTKYFSCPPPDATKWKRGADWFWPNKANGAAFEDGCAQVRLAARLNICQRPPSPPSTYTLIVAAGSSVNHPYGRSAR